MKKTISDLLRHLKVPVSSNYCERLIAAHPDYPSLLSIVDALDRLGITNTAARVQKEQLSDLVFPYVLQLETKHGDMLLIKDARDLDKNREKLEDWNGIVLHVEATNSIVDAEHNSTYHREKFLKRALSVGSIALSIPFLWSAAGASSLLEITIYVSALAGLCIGYLLIAKDLGIRFDVVETFCVSEGYKNDCDTILKSDGSSIFGFKLSDVVFIYFLCEVCCLSMLAVNPVWRSAMFPLMSAISLFAIPAVIYSIGYQFNIKVWCRLCLIVDGILVLQTAALYSSLSHFSLSAFPSGFIFSVVGGSIVLAVAVLLFKERTEQILKLEQAVAEGGRVRNSPFVFRSFLKGGEREVPFHPEQRMISGNKNAPLKFVMAGNLYCKPCSDQHKKIENLIEMFPNHVCVEFRFIRAKDSHAMPNSNQYLIEYWLRNIRQRKDESLLTKKYLLDWYELRDLGKFRKKYPLPDDTLSRECLALEQKHADWFIEQDVIKTPTFFLNGYKLPKEWLPIDIATIIPSLAPDVDKLIINSEAMSSEEFTVPTNI